MCGPARVKRAQILRKTIWCQPEKAITFKSMQDIDTSFGLGWFFFLWCMLGLWKKSRRFCYYFLSKGLFLMRLLARPDALPIPPCLHIVLIQNKHFGLQNIFLVTRTRLLTEEQMQTYHINKGL